MEGYLEKKRKSRLVSLWHRYWFILNGAELSYYENRPTSTSISKKGTVMLTSMTSVSAYSPSHRHDDHPANCEIYILTPSKLLTLRTKDVNDHKTWMCALLGQIAILAKGQARGPVSALPNRSALTAPFPSSHINHRHSLTSLTTMEDIDNKQLSKFSRTMDNKDFKSGSTGNIIDKKNIAATRETDTETSSEEDICVKKGQEAGINSPDGLMHKCQPFEVSASAKISEEKVVCDTRLEDVSKKTNVMDSTHQRENLPVQKMPKSVHNDHKMEKPEIPQSNDQIQESKVKSRKFFGRKDVKTNSVQMSGVKVYKKSRETVAIDRIDADPKLLQVHKANKLSHQERRNSKEDTVLKKRNKDIERSNSATEYKASVAHSPEIGESSLSERNEWMKYPSKPKIKRVKSKKDKSSNQSNEAQRNRRSKLAKSGELLDDGESKTKAKKMGFFSKLVKCKKNENSDEKNEEMEIDPSLESSKESKSPEDEEPPVRETSPEKRIHNIPRHGALTGLMIPKDDAEFQKKLLSRKLKIEADQDSPVEISEKENIKTAVVSAIHEMDIDIDDEKIVITDDDGNKEEKPSLPPRAPVPPPPIPERKNSPHPPRGPRNLMPDRFSTTSSRHKQSPKFQEKYQNQGIEVRNNYDIVKFKVKKKEVVQNTTVNSSQEMNPRVEFSFISEPSSTTDTRKVDTESESLIRNGNREVEVKVRAMKRNDIDKEINKGMAIITQTKTPSNKLCVGNADTMQVEERIKNNIDADFALGKADSMEIPTITFTETYPFTSSIDTIAEFKSTTCSTLNPAVIFNDHSSHIAIQTNTEEEELVNIPSTSLTKMFINSPEKDEIKFNKADELGLLLSELDRINATPLENLNAQENPAPVSNVKRLSSDKEDFLEAFPIRKRRNSDPDYDIPRPHRLPKHIQLIQNLDNNDSSKDDEESKDTETANSITIEATCFLGPGMDQSFNENRYYGFSSNDWNRNSDKKKQYLEYRGVDSDLSEEKDSLEYFEGKEPQEKNSFTDTSEKCLEKEEDSSLESRRDSEISVNLRPEKIDRGCRNKRSREVYKSDLEDLMSLTGTMEYLSIARDLDTDQTVDTSTQENGTFLQDISQIETLNNKLEAGEFDKENYDSRTETVGEQFETVDNMENYDGMAVNISTVADEKRTQQETDLEEKEESEVILRNTTRSDLTDMRDNKTMRLSFATTETLIVEEEVLVASLKTTTTTTFSTAADNQQSIGDREVEESVEEVVLDIDSIADDHFGSMKIQSCVQT